MAARVEQAVADWAGAEVTGADGGPGSPSGVRGGAGPAGPGRAAGAGGWARPCRHWASLAVWVRLARRPKWRMRTKPSGTIWSRKRRGEAAAPRPLTLPR